MKASVINKILEISEPLLVEVNDQKYWSRNQAPVKPVSWHPAALTVASLIGMRDFIEACKPELCERTFLHVVSPREVQLVSPFTGDTLERHTYATTISSPARHTWNDYLALEKFNIWLTIGFVQDEAIAQIISVVSNITDASTVNLADDGITQRAIVKTGLVSHDNVNLPKLLSLRPIRTFPEIDQPASTFLLRTKSTDSGKGDIQAALFISDINNRWELDAVTSIKEWLRSNIPGVPVVG